VSCLIFTFLNTRAKRTDDYGEYDSLLPKEYMNRYDMPVRTSARFLLEHRKLLKGDDALIAFLVWEFDLTFCALTEQKFSTLLST